MGKWIGVFLLLLPSLSTAQVPIDVQKFLRNDSFNRITISPNGDYYAATVPLEDRTGLVVMRRSDLKVTASMAMGKNIHIERFYWASPERLLMSISMKFGSEDTPYLTGEIYAMNVDGTDKKILVGQRKGTSGRPRFQSERQRVVANLVDTLKHDDLRVVVAISSFGEDTVSVAETMDIRNGNRTPITRAPVRNAAFTTDNSGVVRFAAGVGSNLSNQLYYRANAQDRWREINDEATTGRIELPLGFAADDRTAYLQVERGDGPDVVVAFDTSTGKREDLLRDAVHDPHDYLWSLSGDRLVGAAYSQGKPHFKFIDETSEEARLYRSLEKTFAGEAVSITSTTTDGRLALVRTWSDRNPGDFFLFDTVSKKASHVVSQGEWFDPDKMAPMKPVEFKARDGISIHGLLTLPTGSSGARLPMIVMPHGGPFNVQDVWGFDPHVQMLAAAGYAVLQPNFRGSSGYGRHFRVLGAKQWGGTMQDDVTDATRWAIESGIADPRRICIYGASYGAFAALSGVSKEPDLYRCAVGYVGIYDLPMMYTAGDLNDSSSDKTYLREWIGEKGVVGAVSPSNQAGRIKVPVFLAAGGEDERAPIAQSRLMERKLTGSGVPVETLYFDNEGHGFYTEPHRREYYEKLLLFFGKHLGVSAPD